MNWVCGCSLDHNMIRWIDTSAFKGVPKLHQLTLNNNAIKDIQRELFAGTLHICNFNDPTRTKSKFCKILKNGFFQGLLHYRSCLYTTIK
jgi:hypothetical protein